MEKLDEGGLEIATESGVKPGFIPAVMLAVVLNPLNSATISVGLAVLLRALHAPPAGITWIVSGYYLGSAVAQPVVGALGDRMGYRRFVYIGFALVLLTAICAPFSRNLWVFVGWRVVQAVGTSMVYPNAVGLVRRFEARRLPVVLGWIGMAAGIALAVGPALGGLLMAQFGWRAVFWLNIPIALASGLLLWLSVPAEPQHESSRAIRGDWTGSALFAVTMVLFLIVSSGTLPREVGLLSMAGVVALAGLIVWERRTSQPVIPVTWFANPAFALVAGATVLTNIVMYVALYGVPVLLETRRHLSVSASGFMLLVFAGVMAAASPLGGRLARSARRRGPFLGSAILLALASLLIWNGAVRPLWVVASALGLMGLSFAVSNVILQQMVLEMREPGESGSASGLYSLMRYVGTMASSVVIAVAFRGPSSTRILYEALLVVSVASCGIGLGLPRQRAVRGSEG